MVDEQIHGMQIRALQREIELEKSFIDQHER